MRTLFLFLFSTDQRWVLVRNKFPTYINSHETVNIAQLNISIDISPVARVRLTASNSLANCNPLLPRRTPESCFKQFYSYRITI